MDPQANDERALYASVRALIRGLAESVRDGFAHGTPVKVTTDGTISGDLFAAVGAALEYAKHGRTGILAGATLSSLLDRYPAPVECRQPPCGDAGAGDVREVRDDSGAGRGQAERGGVRGQADGTVDSVDGSRQDLARWFSAGVAGFIDIAKRHNTHADDIASGLIEALNSMHVEAVAFCSKAALDAYVAVAVENACSETRRNILRLVSGDVVSGLPDQDVVVACAALRVQTERDQRQADALQSALNDAKRARLDKVTAVRDLELREKELLGTIKGRDRTIDRLCRHIAFGAAKP